VFRNMKGRCSGARWDEGSRRGVVKGDEGRWRPPRSPEGGSARGSRQVGRKGMSPARSAGNAASPVPPAWKQFQQKGVV